MSGFYEAGKFGHRNQSDIFMPSTGDNDVITVIRHIFAKTGESGACLSTGKYFLVMSPTTSHRDNKTFWILVYHWYIKVTGGRGT